MKLSWKKILIIALFAYIVYRMFFVREHNMSSEGVITLTVIGGIIFFLAVGYMFIASAPNE